MYAAIGFNDQFIDYFIYLLLLHFQIEITKRTLSTTHAIMIPTISPDKKLILVTLADVVSVVALPLMADLVALINDFAVELPLVVDLAVLINFVVAK